MKYVALLRGINVGGANKLAMPALRSHCGELGWGDVETYIQSGNVIFSAAGRSSDHEQELEQLIAGKFDLEISVIVRSAAQWNAYVSDVPFAEVAKAEPNRLMLCLSKARPNADALEGLRSKAQDGERLEQVGEALWIHYPAGAGTTKLSPALLNRLFGSPVTARNWRTVVKLQAMLAP